MPAIPTPATIDPLTAFMAGVFDTRGLPIPLISTSLDIEIDGGLATVVTKRIFRNNEAESIEATATFPVPVHAVLFDLEARIDGRLVKARAQRRTQAREAYEDAIERGRAAVLHEEVLRGIHMLSVAHIGPGKEIEVTTTWAAAFSFVGDQGQLRIPLTVGHIYGRSGLPDSDDLLTGGPTQMAELLVHCRNGVATVRGVHVDEGRARVPLNAPIDLAVARAEARELCGVAADGREVILRISPHQAGDKALNVAIVVDHSGSMEGACSGRSGSATKHQAVIAGLRSVAERLGDDDVIDLWEFDHALVHVGSSHDPASRQHGGKRLLSLIARLTYPAGGTEIGAAVHGVISRTNARDILLITDGKSHELDVHKLARHGRRITVVLVGEDSLEANVGHLAALSGGDIFVAAGDDLTDSLATAIGALRSPFERPGPIGALLDRVRVVCGNAILEAEWRPAAAPAADPACNRSVAAMAASLALPGLDAERAALLAESEGLVTHLTSLSLVDEAGEVHEGVPATRKIALPYPAGVADAARAYYRYRLTPPSPSASPPRARLGAFVARLAPHQASLAGSARAGSVEVDPVRTEPLLRDLRIDWDTSPNQLLAGDLSALDPEDAALIARVAAYPEVVALATRMNIAPIVLVVALLAQSQASGNRSAARIAKSVLGDQFTDELIKLGKLIGLD
jgi:hypothetical protein